MNERKTVQQTGPEFGQCTWPAKAAIVTLTAVAFVTTTLAAGFLLLLSLFGRSIHGPPPGIIIFAIPLIAGALSAWGAFSVTKRILAPRDSSN